MPYETTTDNIKELIKFAHSQGVKAFTVYREGSRDFEVLRKVGTVTSRTSSSGVTMVKEEISHPNQRKGITYSIPTGHSTLHVTITNDPMNNLPIEVFCYLGKAGSDESASMEAIGRLISVWLQSSPDPVEVLYTVVKQLMGIGGNKQIFHDKSLVKSVYDGLAKLLNIYLKENWENKLDTGGSTLNSANDYNDYGLRDVIICPSCNTTFVNKGNKCPVCPQCGFSNCEG